VGKDTKELLRKTLYMDKKTEKALKKYIVMADEYNHDFRHEYEVVEAALKAFLPKECFNTEHLKKD
jgi:hypothetical protein